MREFVEFFGRNQRTVTYRWIILIAQIHVYAKWWISAALVAIAWFSRHTLLHRIYNKCKHYICNKLYIYVYIYTYAHISGILCISRHIQLFTTSSCGEKPVENYILEPLPRRAPKRMSNAIGCYFFPLYIYKPFVTAIDTLLRSPYAGDRWKLKSQSRALTNPHVVTLQFSLDFSRRCHVRSSNNKFVVNATVKIHIFSPNFYRMSQDFTRKFHLYATLLAFNQVPIN